MSATDNANVKFIKMKSAILQMVGEGYTFKPSKKNTKAQTNWNKTLSPKVKDEIRDSTQKYDHKFAIDVQSIQE